MKVNVKKENGFTAVDISIAMMVVVIFVTIMSSLLYSVYLSSTEAKRTAMALNYAVEIFEKAGALNYQQIYEEGLLTAAGVTLKGSSSEGAKGEIGTYKFNLKITDPYGDGKIKLITLKIEYPVSAKKTETVEFQRIRTIS